MLTDEPLRLGSALDENRISSTLWPTFMSLFIFIDSFHISDTFGFLFFGCFFFLPLGHADNWQWCEEEKYKYFGNVLK